MYCSLTNQYSTSFSIGIYLLDRSIRPQIYAIYSFVRCADEIVDSFLDYDRAYLLDSFKRDYFDALERGISINPVLNNFQAVARQFDLHSLVDQFFDSMYMDLHKTSYTSIREYEQYILGSAEVVGLMCLKVFTSRDRNKYDELKPFAMKLGSAFQKINFLRDMKADHHQLGRVYFPNVSFETFSDDDKGQIIRDVRTEFSEALKGIRNLPLNCRLGVYVAYQYYLFLLRILGTRRAAEITDRRIRVPNVVKAILLLKAYIRYRLNVL